MKVVLILMFIGVGSSNVPAIRDVRFENLSACQKAADLFLKSQLQWGDARYRAAFCVEDKP